MVCSEANPAVPYKKNRVCTTMVKAAKSFRWSLCQPNHSNGSDEVLFFGAIRARVRVKIGVLGSKRQKGKKA